ncbi:MAG: protoporphyrinogen oxidase [Planctomycetes bacterium]|nr:protoporphyrinogen oxidase [Planctomycetota bacterium]
MIQHVHEPERVDTLVIGAGIGGLAYAHGRGANANVVVVDSASLPGGLVRTVASSSVAGLRWEHGPEALQDNSPETVALARELELELVAAPQSAKKRWLVNGGALHELPTSPTAFLKTPLLGVAAKLRAASERFRAPNVGLDGSLWDFVAERFGREVAETFADPFAAGVWAGDARSISLRAALPAVVKLVEEHGSLLKAMSSHSGKSPTLVKPRGGMGALPGALARELGSRLRLGVAIQSLEKAPGRWRAFHDNGVIDAQRLVLATPPRATSELCAAFAPELAAELATIVHESLVSIAHVWKRAQVGHPLDGFGYLVAKSERDLQLGTLFSSTLAPDSAPDGFVVLRTLVGGARNPLAVELADDALISVVRFEVAPLLRLEGDPELLAITRHAKVLPRYDLDHPRRVASIEKLAAALPNFALASNYLRGIGVNQVIANARALARGHA